MSEPDDAALPADPREPDPGKVWVQAHLIHAGRELGLAFTAAVEAMAPALERLAQAAERQLERERRAAAQFGAARRFTSRR